MADDEQTLFVMTKRVKEALELINALDESKLAVIVKRLVKNVGGKGAPFTTEELEQLQDHLSLAEGQVRRAKKDRTDRDREKIKLHGAMFHAYVRERGETE